MRAYIYQTIMLPMTKTTQVGYITEDDVKILTKSQKKLIDQIIDKGPCPAGQLDYKQVKVKLLLPEIKA